LPNIEARQHNTFLLDVIYSVLPILVVAGLIWYFFIRRIKRISRESPQTATPTPQQRDRFEQLLDKWEEQARRMDSILERMEKK
jgi:hypothetical protein